jgi:pyruvate/2-oxoglutarate dehydrogenase complex dihydrolipoamide dehydrogenase (E3) component
VKKKYKVNQGAEPLEPDLCVIGAGSAGLSVASIAASLGASVVLIEKHRMGGECLNAGCVPSKALIAAAARAHMIRTGSRFGIGLEGDEPTVDFAQVQKHVKGVVAAIAPMDSVERYIAMGVQVIQAEAHFTDARTVSAGGKLIKARRFVIATGSRPAMPSIPGLDRVPYRTNETIFDLTERPDHLVVIGGGAVGVELAQAYRRLGSKVSLIEAGERILSREDPEMVAVIERSLQAEDVAVRTGSTIRRIEPRPVGRFAVVFESDQETIEGSHLLVAVGRQPITDGLDLEAAGIKADTSGILINKGLKTSNPKVYAIGDCVGGTGTGGRFTHVANHHAGLVIRNALFGLPVRLDEAPIPRVVYTDPELAAVGLTEEEARADRRSVKILRWSFADNDRARADDATKGHVKAVVSPQGRILGCAMAGPHAGELIMPWVLAMTRGLKVSDLAGLVYPYPSLSEVTKSTAVEFLKPSTQNPWLRRVIGLVRRLG